MNANDLPPGIQVEIESPDGVARESFTQYGRSVHFADGTVYSIRVINTTAKHAALDLTIDGTKANLTPILLYRPKRGHEEGRHREIKGFDLTRNTVELPNDTFEITGTYTPFVAIRMPSAYASSTTNRKIGTIRFEFFATRYATRQPGRTQQFTAKDAAPSLHNARPGVLATGRHGAVLDKSGMHRKGEENTKSGRRPIADPNRLFDPAVSSFEITICELPQGLALGTDHDFSTTFT